MIYFFLHKRRTSAKPTTDREECEKFIMHMLEENGGEMETKALDESAQEAGYSKATARRAKDKLKSNGEIKYFSTGNGKKNKTWYTQSLVFEGVVEEENPVE